MSTSVLVTKERQPGSPFGLERCTEVLSYAILQA